MFARVRLFTSGVRDTLVVPEESLFPVGDDKYVYKVVDNKAVRQKIEIGTRRDGRVEVVMSWRPKTRCDRSVIKLRERRGRAIATRPLGSEQAPHDRGARQGCPVDSPELHPRPVFGHGLSTSAAHRRISYSRGRAGIPRASQPVVP